MERHHLCRHLVKNSTKREQICSRIQFLGADLFGRHVRNGSDCRFPGVVSCFSNVTVDDAVAPAPRTSLRMGITFANPKSKILACPRAVTKIFAGLMSRCTMLVLTAAKNGAVIAGLGRSHGASS